MNLFINFYILSINSIIEKSAAKANQVPRHARKPRLVPQFKKQNKGDKILEKPTEQITPDMKGKILIGGSFLSLDAYKKALSSDPSSAFGGIIALNSEIDENLAKEITKQFVEVMFYGNSGIFAHYCSNSCCIKFT